LVSTISFSGVDRMDYSLLGNNVLKDHSWPTLSLLSTPEVAPLLSRFLRQRRGVWLPIPLPRPWSTTRCRLVPRCARLTTVEPSIIKDLQPHQARSESAPLFSLSRVTHI